MKTLHTTTNNVTFGHGHIRLVVTLAGIVTAVLCSMALRYDGLSAELMDGGAFHLLKFSKVVATNLAGEVKTWL